MQNLLSLHVTSFSLALYLTDDGNKLTEPNTVATDLLSSLLPSNDESPIDTTTTPPQEPQITTPEVATKPETVENVEDAGIEVAQQEATSAVATSDDTVQPTQRSEEGVEAAKDKWVTTGSEIV